MLRGLYLLLAGFLILAPAVQAQVGLVDSEQQRLLEVRQRQIDLRESRAALARALELRTEGLISESELERNETDLETAQLRYQQAVLALLGLQPRLSVKEAVKYQADDGRRLVRLTVTNLTPTFDDSQFNLLNNFEGADPIPSALLQRNVRDVFISLHDISEPSAGGFGSGKGVAIALPYERHIPELKYNQSVTHTFQLLRDVDRLSVLFSYRGQEHEIGIQLKLAETDNEIRVTSNQITQEGDLGQPVTYDLRLERSSLDVRTFQLRVLNLPPQVSHSFLDPDSSARLSQISMAAGVGEVALKLRLFLPERVGEGFLLDEPLEFWPAVLTDEQSRELAEVRGYSAEKLADSRAGLVRLELIPRGIGEMTLSAPSLFSEIRSGEVVDTVLTLRNTGTRRLDNVTVSTEYPFGWRTELDPSEIPSLDVNGEAQVRMHIFAKDDVAVGDYEVRIKAESTADNRLVPTEDKIYRVSVKARANILGTIALLVMLLGTVAAIVWIAIRVTRR